MKVMIDDERPLGWAPAQLGDIIELKYGKALPDRLRTGSGFPVYGSNGVVGHHAESLTNGETIVVGRKGSVGAVQYCDGPCSPIDTTYFIDQLHGLPAKYWFHFLRSLQLVDLNKATAVPGLNREDAYRLEILVPPIAEQKRIADKLEAVLGRVEACRARLDRVPALLKRFRQSVLAAATSGQLTEDWRTKNVVNEKWRTALFEDFCHEITVGYVGKMADAYTDSGIPFLRSLNVRPFKFNKLDLKYISPRFHHSISKSTLRPGDVVVVRTGAPGQCCVIPPELREANCSDLVIVRCGEELLPDFAVVFINSETSQEFVKSERVGVAQAHFNVGSMKKAPLHLPTVPEQAEIVRRVEALFALADRIESRLTEARAQVERLTPAVLAKAFRGELVPQDSKDEPASTLLDKIKQPPKQVIKIPKKRTP